MSLHQRLCDAVNEARIGQTALELVSIPSPTGFTREATRYFETAYRELGCEITRIDGIKGSPSGTDAPSVAARLRGTGAAPTLQIDGHIDTIPAAHAPASLVDNVLSGRGASDMKGGLAAVMEAARVLREVRVQLPGDLLLTTHGLHEAPTGHGEGLLALISEGLHGAAAVVAEGPVDELAITGRGMAIFTITVKTTGKSGHENDTPPNTPHPLVAAADALRALEAERVRLQRTMRPYVGSETIFFGQLHGGDFYNRFPVEATIQGTRRYFDDHDFQDVRKEMEAILARVAEDTGTTITLDLDRIRDGFRVSENERIVHAFRWSYRTLNGKGPPLGAFKSVADVSLLVQAAGIPAVFCGNRGTGAHADREEVDVRELVHQTRMLLGIIVAYFGLET